MDVNKAGSQASGGRALANWLAESACQWAPTAAAAAAAAASRKLSGGINLFIASSAGPTSKPGMELIDRRDMIAIEPARNWPTSASERASRRLQATAATSKEGRGRAS